MWTISPEHAALNLLRRAFNAGASVDEARRIVLGKLAGLYRDRSEGDLRNALAHAWAEYRRGR